MKQTLAHTFIILSLILSLTSFILSLTALYLPNWKYIHLRSTFVPIVSSDNHPMDPLIRSEVDKFIDILYHRGQTHSFGLLTHCILGNECGRNNLLSFDETNYGICHNINYHHQCIFSNPLLLINDHKCTCQQPSYVKIIHKLLTFLILLEILFFLVNILRLSRHYCIKYCLNDIHFRLISLLTSLFSLLFLIIIIIQYNGNRLNEPLEFFESMRRHYSRIQIYTFSKDLELIIQQFQNALDIRIGASFICILITLILIILAFLASTTVEIKISSISSSLNVNDDEEKKHYQYQNHNNNNSNNNNNIIQHDISLDSTQIERFVPSEQIRYTRQTKV